MAVNEQLFALVEEYFQGRAERAILPSFPAFRSVRSSALESFNQRRMYEEGFGEPKEYEICLENLLGWEEERRKILQELSRFAHQAATVLYGFSSPAIEITKRLLMTNGTCLPLQIVLRLNAPDSEPLERTMYFKPFDLVRLAGLELYTLIGGLEVPYNFIFNRELIIEDQVEGLHEFQLTKSVATRPHYWKERIKADVISIYLGLDDCAKKDNYLISSAGEIRFIDFDVMDRDYRAEAIAAIQSKTALELGLSPESYGKIYKEQKQLLQHRVQRHREPIQKLVRILLRSPDSTLQQIGEYIWKNTERDINTWLP